MGTLDWARVKEVFSQAKDLGREARVSYLEAVCAGDRELRSEVEDLLGHLEDEPATGTAMAPASGVDTAPGSRLGPYRLLEEIGRGGMSVVYRAERADDEFRREVAIKILSSEMGTDEDAGRFRNERQILADFDHPHIARLIDGGVTAEGRPYFVMEYVRGAPVDDYCLEKGLGMAAVLGLFQAVCLAVHHAHQHLVIHRDLKPANVLVGAEGVPKLLDFGIAKQLDPDRHGRDATRTAVPMMTLRYASPEQIRGEPLTTATDIYSLGVVLCHLLTGSLPYRVKAGYPEEYIRAILEREPLSPSDIAAAREAKDEEGASADRAPRPTVSRARFASCALRGDLDTIVLKAICKEPERRYESAKALADDIGLYLAGRPIQARSAGWTYVLGKLLRRHRRAVCLTAIALVAVLTLAGLWAASRRAAAEQARLAQLFGGEVEGLRWSFRVAEMMPRHDVRPEKARLRARIANVERFAQGLGDAARGPGWWAMGEGYLALDENAKARDCLEKAWNVGYCTPAVAGAYGLALARLYWEEKDAVDKLKAREIREQAQRMIEKQYRDPAVVLLRSGQAGHVGPGAYVEGVIDLLEGRFEQALVRAREAFRASPWLFEALILEGDIHNFRGYDKLNRNRPDDARADWSAAARSYHAAADLARSSLRCRRRLLFIAKTTLDLDVEARRPDLAPQFDEARRAFEEACSVDPDVAAVYADAAEIDFLAAQWREWTGLDPLPDLERARRTAERGVACPPGPRRQSARPLGALGLALSAIGQYRGRHGEDALPSLTASVAALRQAVACQPGDVAYQFNLANACCLLGEHRQARGQDAQTELEEARRLYEAIVAVYPQAPNPCNNLGKVLNSLAIGVGERGGDPRPLFRQAADRYEKTLRLNPCHRFAAANLGDTWSRVAEWEIRHGQDPTLAAHRSETALRRALAIDSDDALAYINWTDLDRLMAEYLVGAGRDLSCRIRSGSEHYHQAIARQKRYAEPHVSMGRIMLIAARAEAARDRSPMARLAQAHLFFKQALRVDPRSVEARRGEAEAWLREARWALRRNTASRPLFDRALAALSAARQECPTAVDTLVLAAEIQLWLFRSLAEEKTDNRPRANEALAEGRRSIDLALAAQAGLPRALALRGVLTAEAARREKDPSRRAVLGAVARADLDRALAAAPSLQYEFGPDIDRCPR